ERTAAGGFGGNVRHGDTRRAGAGTLRGNPELYGAAAGREGGFLPRMTRITRIYADLAEASANTALFTCFSSDGLPAPILPRPDPCNPRKSVANPLLLLHAPGSLAEA